MKHLKCFNTFFRMVGVFWILLVLIITIVAGDILPVTAGQRVGEMVSSNLDPIEEFPDKPQIETLSTALDQIFTDWIENPQVARSFAETRGIHLKADRLQIMLIMLDEASAASAVDVIPQLGGRVIGRYKTWIDAWVSIEMLDEIAALQGVSLVREPIQVFPIEQNLQPSRSPVLSGLVQSQGVSLSNADDWHAAGITGSGVKVAVIDFFKDYTLAQAEGELPAEITIYGEIDLSSRHGTAVAEIIYDMAPGVELTFAFPIIEQAYPEEPPQIATARGMASLIVELAQSGNQIISSSIGPMQAGPGDGTGVLADAVRTAHDTYGTLYIQAAGNQAKLHWDGLFTDTDHDGWHEFTSYPIDPEFNWIGFIDGGNLISVSLRWDDWSASDQDYDLYLVRDGGIVDHSTITQNGTQPPLEEINYITTAIGLYGVKVHQYNAEGTAVLDLISYGGDGFTYKVSSRSLIDPACATNALSVGAVDVERPHPLESYSSRGPTHGPGGSLSGGVDQPRLAGFANVDTWSYGPASFAGTSAAAPHVSGAAALVWSVLTDYTPDQVMSFLESRAIDQGPLGYDHSYGAGRLYLGDPYILPSEWIYLPIILK
jgi:subtilisin family serine protease